MPKKKAKRSASKKSTKKSAAKEKAAKKTKKAKSDDKNSEAKNVVAAVQEVVLKDVEAEKQENKVKEVVKKPKVKVKALYARERVITENSDLARELYNQSRYGNVLEDGKVQLSLPEGLYLVEKGKIDVLDSKKKKIDFEKYIALAKKVEPNFWIRYCVFKDMRNRGYIIKTALKFGADFRVYDRGVKPGEDHARWIVYPVHEGEQLTWYEFAAKTRVAHSTKKRLMIGVVDDEGDVTYWEIRWIRP